MVRLLQLLAANADFETRRSVQQLCAGLGDGFAPQVRTIGPGGNYRNAAAAILGLRRSAPEVDLIHAWGLPALSAAAMGTSRPIVYTPQPCVRRRHLRWLQAIMHYRQLQVICPTTTLCRTYLAYGVPPERCHLIRPGVDFAKVHRRRDPALRAALGFKEDDYVLLAAGETTAAADHRTAMWAAGILHVLDERYKLLLWGKGPSLAAVAHLPQRFRRPALASLAQQQLGRPLDLEQLLPATDLVLVTADAPIPTLPIAISMAAALPIVGTATSSVAELLEDRHNCLLVPPHAPRLLAQHVLKLQDDPQLQWSLADTARTEAFQYLPLTHFLSQFRTAYQQVAAGAPVLLPNQSKTNIER